jgi:hypothetical protein
MGFFLRPKDTNLDKANSHINAETVLPAQDGIDDEYIPTTGFNPDTHGKSGADHRRDPIRREAEPNAPLPSGGKPKGYTGAVRGWRGPVAKNVPSGFGKGSRSGR